MNILFLHPHPGVARSAQYRRAALELRSFGHSVVFVYTGAPVHFADTLPTEHYDSWVGANRATIEDARIIEIERTFPKSNLWRCLVAQRTHADYSYIGKTAPITPYSLPELEFYVKSVVLFYQHVLEKYEIEAAVCHAPDCIHSQALFELALSRPFIPINPYYDPYWGLRGRYLVDAVSFSSTLVRRRHWAYLQDYERVVKPREGELEGLIAHCIQADPRQVLTKLGWAVTFPNTFRNAIAGLLQAGHFLTLARLNVLRGYYMMPFGRHASAWCRRLMNLFYKRFMFRFAAAPPDTPYVSFAPHYQPEAATLAAAPVWSDMLAIVRMLSVSVPAGVKVVVKDHPIMGGYRPISFYRLAKRLPNVVVLRDSYPSMPLLKGAALVVTVIGTVGLQALMLWKRVLVLGDPVYADVAGVFKPPADLNQLPVVLKQALLTEPGPDPAARRRSLLAFLCALKDSLVTNERLDRATSEEELGAGLAEVVDHWARYDIPELLATHPANTRIAVGANL